MNEYDKKEITQWLKDNIPLILDMEENELKYNDRSIYYKTLKYITKLQNELKKLKGIDK